MAPPSSSHKASVIARQMGEALKLRTGLALFQSVDASGNPTLLLGSGAAGSQSAFIRIKLEESIQTDPVTYSAARVYTPHITQVVLETSSVAGLPLLNAGNYAKLLLDVTQPGTKVEIYLSANGNAVGVEDIVSANKVATLDDLFHPLTSTM
jgi:hypothetical protein